MQAAAQAVKEHLSRGNHHSVDIEQVANPAVVHERVIQKQHEDRVEAIDREVHQHHHQIHVQPVRDQVLETEQHHHNVIPIAHREHHHGKDREIETALASQAGKFRDEREVLPVETTSANKVLVGEHVHHHIHDIIQPVVERETVQPHVVHTTVPIHERVEHEPHIHKGNVLPALTMDEFSRAGHSLTGGRKAPEHIEYEGEPLKIDGKSHVGFGAGVLGGHHNNTTGTGLGNDYTTGSGVSGDSNVPRSLRNDETTTGTTGTSGNANVGPHKSSLLNKLDPRVDSDVDGSKLH